jgi:hypothetical protein
MLCALWPPLCRLLPILGGWKPSASLTGSPSFIHLSVQCAHRCFTPTPKPLLAATSRRWTEAMCGAPFRRRYAAAPLPRRWDPLPELWRQQHVNRCLLLLPIHACCLFGAQFLSPPPRLEGSDRQADNTIKAPLACSLCLAHTYLATHTHRRSSRVVGLPAPMAARNT